MQLFGGIAVAPPMGDEPAGTVMLPVFSAYVDRYLFGCHFHFQTAKLDAIRSKLAASLAEAKRVAAVQAAARAAGMAEDEFVPVSEAADGADPGVDVTIEQAVALHTQQFLAALHAPSLKEHFRLLRALLRATRPEDVALRALFAGAYGLWDAVSEDLDLTDEAEEEKCRNLANRYLLGVATDAAYLREMVLSCRRAYVPRLGLNGTGGSESINASFRAGASVAGHQTRATWDLATILVGSRSNAHANASCYSTINSDRLSAAASNPIAEAKGRCKERFHSEAAKIVLAYFDGTVRFEFTNRAYLHAVLRLRADGSGSCAQHSAATTGSTPLGAPQAPPAGVARSTHSSSAAESPTSAIDQLRKEDEAGPDFVRCPLTAVLSYYRLLALAKHVGPDLAARVADVLDAATKCEQESRKMRATARQQHRCCGVCEIDLARGMPVGDSPCPLVPAFNPHLLAAQVIAYFVLGPKSTAWRGACVPAADIAETWWRVQDLRARRGQPRLDASVPLPDARPRAEAAGPAFRPPPPDSLLGAAHQSHLTSASLRAAAAVAAATSAPDAPSGSEPPISAEELAEFAAHAKKLQRKADYARRTTQRDAVLAEFMGADGASSSAALNGSSDGAAVARLPNANFFRPARKDDAAAPVVAARLAADPGSLAAGVASGAVRSIAGQQPLQLSDSMLQGLSIATVGRTKSHAATSAGNRAKVAAEALRQHQVVASQLFSQLQSAVRLGSGTAQHKRLLGVDISAEALLQLRDGQHAGAALTHALHQVARQLVSLDLVSSPQCLIPATGHTQCSARTPLPWPPDYLDALRRCHQSGDAAMMAAAMAAGRAPHPFTDHDPLRCLVGYPRHWFVGTAHPPGASTRARQYALLVTTSSAGAPWQVEICCPRDLIQQDAAEAGAGGRAATYHAVDSIMDAVHALQSAVEFVGRRVVWAATTLNPLWSSPSHCDDGLQIAAGPLLHHEAACLAGPVCAVAAGVERGRKLRNLLARAVNAGGDGRLPVPQSLGRLGHAGHHVPSVLSAAAKRWKLPAVATDASVVGPTLAAWAAGGAARPIYNPSSFCYMISALQLGCEQLLDGAVPDALRNLLLQIGQAASESATPIRLRDHAGAMQVLKEQAAACNFPISLNVTPDGALSTGQEDAADPLLSSLQHSGYGVKVGVEVQRLPAESTACDVLGEHATACVCGAALESVKEQVTQFLPVYLPEPGHAPGPVSMSTAAARGYEDNLDMTDSIPCPAECVNRFCYRSQIKLLEAPERLFAWVQRFKAVQAPAAAGASGSRSRGEFVSARNDSPIQPSMELRVSVRENGRQSKPVDYVMRGAILHQGSLRSGHYVTLCWRGGRFVLLNDAECIALRRGEEFEHLKELGWDFATTCYIVLYHKAVVDAGAAGAGAGSSTASGDASGTAAGATGAGAGFSGGATAASATAALAAAVSHGAGDLIDLDVDSGSDADDEIAILPSQAEARGCSSGSASAAAAHHRPRRHRPAVITLDDSDSDSDSDSKVAAASSRRRIVAKRVPSGPPRRSKRSRHGTGVVGDEAATAVPSESNGEPAAGGDSTETAQLRRACWLTLADLSKLLLALRTRKLTKNVSLRVDRFVLQELDGAREVAEGDRVPLRAVDLAVLKPGKWLTGDIIGAVLVLIVARHKRLRAERAVAIAAGVAETDLPRLPNLIVWNTQFWSKLTEDARADDPARPGCKVVVESGYCYANVGRWTREHKPTGRPGVDVSGADVILVPVNHSNVHWALAVLWPQRREVAYWDSLGGLGHRAHVCRTLIRWYADEVEAKGLRCTPWPGGVAPEGAEVTRSPAAVANAVGAASAAAPVPPPPSVGGLSKEEVQAQWTIMPAQPRLPQQDNGIDCGVFLLGYAEWASLGLEDFLLAGSFAMKDIDAMRIGYAAALLQHQLLPRSLQSGRSTEELPDMPPLSRDAAARTEGGSIGGPGKEAVGSKRGRPAADRDR